MNNFYYYIINSNLNYNHVAYNIDINCNIHILKDIYFLGQQWQRKRFFIC